MNVETEPRMKWCGDGKTEPTENLGAVSNLKFFHMMHIYEIVGIFQFFHYSQYRYSISIDTQKTRDPNFGGGW